MTYHSTRRLLSLASAVALAGSLMSLGANSQAAGLTADTDRTGTSYSTSTRHHFWEALALEQTDAWSRLRDNFQWQHEPPNARVRHWIDRYRANPHNIHEITERARPWLAWITRQVEARGLPGEIALIPFVESSFDPLARSHRGAAGLWQFMPGTGDALGLRRNAAYDGRLDVVNSTRAALDYIELQADQWYDGDIPLSLAAYNAGAGNVNRARHASLARGEQGSYWDLSLPGETMHYIPKLKAIAAIIDNPEGHDVELPAIDDVPAFARIPLTRPMKLEEVARLAGVSRHALVELNPALIDGSADPRHTRALLVPADHEESLLARLDGTSTDSSAGRGESYVVRRGDNLSAIAARQGISVEELRRHNGIAGESLRVGQVLAIPRTSLAYR
jgi:membrane-bound lytic murein transglycosylase D